MRVMFICTGNICRSAMAHVMLEKRAKEENKNVEVYSCGVFAQNGDVSTIEAIETMKEYGVDLKHHRATNIRNSNIEDMDVILCATTSHKNNVSNMYPQLQDKIFTIKEYVRISPKWFRYKRSLGIWNGYIYKLCKRNRRLYRKNNKNNLKSIFKNERGLSSFVQEILNLLTT